MLGTGSIAEFRAQVYARLQGVKVVGVLGRDAGRTRAFAQKHDIMSAATSFEALLDMGCHLIGAFNLLGKRRAEAVFAHTPTRHHDTDCEDAALAIIRYEGGLVGQAEASWTQRGGMAVTFEVWGDEGMITYDRSGLSQPIKVFTRQQTDRYFSEKVEHRQGWLFPTVQEYWRYGYYDQIRHFVACVRGETAPLLTFEDGLEVNRIIDAAYAFGPLGGLGARGLSRNHPEHPRR